MGLAVLTGGAGYMWLFASIIPAMPRQPLVAGAIIGLMFGGIAPAMRLPVIVFLALVDRSTLPTIDDPMLVLWTSLAAAAGFAVGGILLIQMFVLMRWSGGWAFLLVPAGVAIFPLARQLFWAPALLAGLRRRQRHLEPACASELRAWSDQIFETYRLRKIDVLFGPAKHVNAAAVGFCPLTRFIMIGDGLTLVVPLTEVRAILAHEIAHVLRADVRNQLLLWMAFGTLWTYLSVAVRVSLDLRGPYWAIALGMGWVGVALLAGRYSRHCALAADRLAAELTDDPDALRAALTRLAAMTKAPADRRLPTHPSLNDRLASLGGRTG